MKELSIEEKAKRYDEVVAMAKESITYIPDDAVNKYMLNMFPELKESEDERIRGKLIELFHDTVSNDEIFSDYGLDKTEVIAWLEKQGKQKPIDAVESIFKVGNWIVNNQSKYTFLVKRGAPRYQAEDTKGNIYSFYLLPNGEEEYHLWTIEDAKDGDVLVSESNQPFIYNGKYTDYTAHIGISYDGKELFIVGGYNWTTNKNVKPATKEQQDLLFQRIKEAGYGWDAYKKELKKL